jgi:hypothetical protein
MRAMTATAVRSRRSTFEMSAEPSGRWFPFILVLSLLELPNLEVDTRPADALRNEKRSRNEPYIHPRPQGKVGSTNRAQILMSLLSCVVTTDGVSIGNRIYWWLQHTTCNYTLQITITLKLVSSVTVFTTLLGNVFRKSTSPSSGSRTAAGLSYQLPQLSPSCSLSLTARTAQKIPLPSTLLLLYACLFGYHVTATETSPSNGRVYRAVL